jgi:hypothetical protein
MTIPRWYLVYGALLLALTATAEWRGWSLADRNEGHTDPRSVRNNPGSYRSVYIGGSRYRYGK